jgi:uncharacterized protein YneF (UPF0154 family)
MNSKEPQDNPWKAVGLISALGADLVVCMAGGYFLGKFLSWWLEQAVWLPISVIFGLLVGIFSVSVIIKRYLRETK